MARPKKLNMVKMKTSLKRAEADLKDWKTRIRQAVDSGEHKTAEAAIKLLTKSKDGLEKLLNHVETHAEKKRPKAEQPTN
jgi:hypothetical protein